MTSPRDVPRACWASTRSKLARTLLHGRCHGLFVARRCADREGLRRTDASSVLEGPVRSKKLPIRFSPIAATSGVLPFSRVKPGVGWCGDLAGDAEKGEKGIEWVDRRLKRKVNSLR